MRTFEGRNGIQFRTFLAYYVLRSLFLEWQRGNRELDTVSLSDHELAAGEAADPRIEFATDETPSALVPSETVSTLWRGLGPEEQLDLKLLSLLEYHLTAEDVRLLSQVSRRPLEDTIALLAEVEAGLRDRDVKLAKLRDELDSVWGWIVLRQRELQETSEKLRLMGSDHQSAAARRLVERREGLERALAKRVRQRESLLEEIGGFKMTTPYKDIARLLNLTVGTVCSRIFRLRQRLERRLKPGEGVP